MFFRIRVAVPYHTLSSKIILSLTPKEFNEYPIKQGQKTFLNLVYNKLGKYHYKGKVKGPEHKVTSVLMAVLGDIKIEDMSLLLEVDGVMIRLFVLGRCSRLLYESVRLFSSISPTISQRHFAPVNNSQNNLLKQKPLSQSPIQPSCCYGHINSFELSHRRLGVMVRMFFFNSSFIHICMIHRKESDLLPYTTSSKDS